MEPRLK